MVKEYIIPPLRQDLEYDVTEDGKEKEVVLYDPEGFASQPAAFPVPFFPIIFKIDGKITNIQLEALIRDEFGEYSEFVLKHLFSLLDKLDGMLFLDSQNFWDAKSDRNDYLASPVREPVCAGEAYPAKPEGLRIYLDNILSSFSADRQIPVPKGIIVPHIDFRTGFGAQKSYASAYQLLRNTDAELFIILGTAHHSATTGFMFTEKDFITPYGTVQTDKNLIDRLRTNLKGSFVIDDLAHRFEHSIELQLVWLQHVMEGRNYTILPILVGSFYDYIKKKEKPSANPDYFYITEAIAESVINCGSEAVYIASADFGHIGRKFGDNFDAFSHLEGLRSSDEILIKHLLNCDSEKFFDDVSKHSDKTRICGLSPIYSMLKILEPKNSHFLEYHQWHETEKNSAVSFASMIFY